MIQLTAPSISATLAAANGAAPAALPEGAGTAVFAALLGDAQSLAAAPQDSAQEIMEVMTAALAGLPDGKPGKAGGKTLPAGDVPAAAHDLETSEAPDDADLDQANVPIAVAIPVLPLIVPPLPGASHTAEFRAAVPDSTTAMVASQPRALPEVAARTAQIATAAPVARQAEAAGFAPAEVLQVRLAPIVTGDARAQGEAPVALVTTAQTVAAKVASQPLPAAVAPEAAAAIPLAPAKAADARPQPNAAPAAIAHTAAPSAVAARAATPPATAETGIPVANAATKGEPNTAAPARDGQAEPAAKPEAAEAAIRTPTPAAHLSTAPAAAFARPIEAAPAPVAAPASSEQPHDFATLVDRLSEAREAASPQVVRTALQHAEFGRVSLQFRHDDANLSVTMASTDAAFTSAVHSAVAASLAGNAAGSGEQPRSGESQQQQQQQGAAQQQSAASSGNGQGQGQQQAAQARADPENRTFNRAPASSARAQQGETATHDRADTGTRRSGIYA